MEDFWQIREWFDFFNFKQAWHDFPGPQKILTAIAVGVLFVYLFVRNHHEGGNRYPWYGVIAVLFLGYALAVATGYSG